MNNIELLIQKFKPANVTPVVSLGINEVLSHRTSVTKKKYSKFNIKKTEIETKMDHQKFDIFSKSKECICCGLKATKMLLLHENDKYHWNMFARVGDHDILFSVDHINPVSNGGTAKNNLQTMCSLCNNLKGDWVVNNDELRRFRDFYCRLLEKKINIAPKTARNLWINRYNIFKISTKIS